MLSKIFISDIFNPCASIKGLLIGTLAFIGKKLLNSEPVLQRLFKYRLTSQQLLEEPSKCMSRLKDDLWSIHALFSFLNLYFITGFHIYKDDLSLEDQRFYSKIMSYSVPILIGSNLAVLYDKIMK